MYGYGKPLRVIISFYFIINCKKKKRKMHILTRYLLKQKKILMIKKN